eukprot:CAMPEP_0169255352 /NCGR_PEP_ID=MMETSP1016-20121227/39677_1 /TAXON_ID=342587 /ORGANISM="Karlodinium micrum, Strain CCMP2283" /LENGTH=79 /DNA_ID=CAMNT_0009336903 /DNA_START=331 /DNA_END=569 /DNA_ORIENTATION=-
MPPEAMLTAKNMPKFSFGLYLGNIFLMVSLKDKLKALSGKVADAVGEIPTPKSCHALLCMDAREAINDAGIPLNLSTSD